MADKMVFGVATASYQIEGAYNEDGKGMSIWDDYTHSGYCDGGFTGDVACDHYHRFKEDVKLMAELGIDAYRFSISWSRILPEGIGKVNQKGIDFYNNLIDCLLEHNIAPYITLFHWDYPSALERRGGWRSPESSDWFEYYAEVVFKNFSNRVKHFITFNEPQCFISSAYIGGGLAPGLNMSEHDVLPMAHNVLLAHGKAVRKLRETAPDCKIGYAPTSSPFIPYSDSKEHIEAARTEYFAIRNMNWSWSVTWWSDPIFFGHYPSDFAEFEELEKYLPANYKEDMKIISEPIDFYCQNIYFGQFMKPDGKGGYKVVHEPVNTSHTGVNWPVTPEALYWGPKFLYERYKVPFIISENGMSCHDTVSLDGKVHDPNRIDYLARYLIELNKAKDEGADIRGYFCWSMMDNFEWKLGYTPRFGLVYTNYDTLERIPKDSYYWYRDYIKNYNK
ncbi:MAG: beta-glucosidase [Clostridiales bacterium]|nr:beta-glucosidase [Candidatus Equinaster intestinalis]